MKKLITIILALIMTLFSAPQKCADQPHVTAEKTPQTAITTTAEQVPEGSGKPAETAFVGEVTEVETTTEGKKDEAPVVQETVTEECTEVAEESVTKLEEDTVEYTDYVCVDALGKLYDPDFVTGHFGQLLKKHNLKKIRFHDLRHSCASVLLAQGVPMKQIQEWLGHSDMSTTADIYSHLDAVTKADTGAAMSKALG